jgi:hypothetical protein
MSPNLDDKAIESSTTSSSVIQTTSSTSITTNSSVTSVASNSSLSNNSFSADRIVYSNSNYRAQIALKENFLTKIRIIDRSDISYVSL